MLYLTTLDTFDLIFDADPSITTFEAAVVAAWEDLYEDSIMKYYDRAENVQELENAFEKLKTTDIPWREKLQILSAKIDEMEKIEIQMERAENEAMQLMQLRRLMYIAAGKEDML